MEIALARCKDAKISPELHKSLRMPNIVFGKYESFVRSAPWTRHPATDSLRQICAILTVRGFHPSHFPWTKLFPFRRVNLPVSMNLALTRDWKPFGAPLPGRLYQTPTLLTPDWAYSMSSWFDLVYSHSLGTKCYSLGLMYAPKIGTVLGQNIRQQDFGPIWTQS